MRTGRGVDLSAHRRRAVRWLTWARAFRSRRTARCANRSRAARSFLHSAPRLWILERRLERLQPIGVRLAIAPVLRALERSSRTIETRTGRAILYRHESNTQVLPALDRPTTSSGSTGARASRLERVQQQVERSYRHTLHLDIAVQRLRRDVQEREVAATRERVERLIRDVRLRVRRIERNARAESPRRVFASAAPSVGSRELEQPWVEGAPVPPRGRPLTPAAEQTRPVDVDAVASQVMRRIDRRLHAWQERTGRV